MVSQDFAAFPPAPLSEGQLAAALRPFGESRMLPPAAYTSAEVFAWEREHFFGGGWTCAGHASRLPAAGDQLAVETGAGSAILVRGEDGTVRAFANTCRHRGHELLPRACETRASETRAGGAGNRAAVNAKAIICPYHSWAYSLSGELRGAPGYRGLSPRDWSLRQLPAVEWHGLIFVDGSGGAAGPLPLSGLDPLVAPYEPSRLVVAATHTYDAAANWKILSENYHECYHCPTIHPELCSVSPPHSGENYDSSGAWIGGWMELRDGAVTMSLDGHSNGVPLRGLTGDELRTVIYVGIFPNVLLSLHPDYVMTHVLVPTAADRTVIECSWAFAPEAVAAPGFDPAYAVDFWDLTNRQDWSACESVQRGLQSPFAAPGPLSPDEDAVYSFVTTVARGYLGARVGEWPATHAGTVAADG
ncbi:MAG TPA: aromatic ring-hydroxylating dioxygenase subunit alpha [Trebonia sp.]|jgi:Rieske 2Fe-2S family protein